MAKTMKARLLATAFLVVIAIPLLLSLGAQQAYAADEWPDPDPNKIYITFAKEKNGAGQVTSLKANIDIGMPLPNATYILNVYRNGKQMSTDSITSTTYDLSEKILGENGWGSGTYSVAGYALATINNEFVYVEMYSERVEFRLHTITIDSGGHGDNVVLRNVDNGTEAFNLLWNGYIQPLTDEMIPTEYYDNGQALVGVALYPKDHYTNMANLDAQMFYTLPFSGASGTIGGNATLYAIWFDVLDQVELTVTAPACGTETTTLKNTDGSWNMDSQTNPPALSVPEGSHYHFSDGSLASTGLWYADESESRPYVGEITGGSSYPFVGYLESDYGYVFPGESDGLAINCAVNGGSFISWANESVEDDKLYGLWLNPDSGFGTTPLWVTGSIDMEHAWDGGTITKAKPGTNGAIVYACETCGDTYETPISMPTTIELSKDSYVYDGTAKKPGVTVENVAGEVIDPANYDVTYEGNTGAGQAKAIVTFKGDYYEGALEEGFTIERKPITVTADNASKVFGDDDPQELTVTVKGLAEGDGVSLIVYKVARDPGDDIGTYAIKVTGDAEQGNYVVSFVNGVFTVKGLPATITASNKSVAMGKTVKVGAKVDSGGAITYKSSNTKVAKVSSTGVITPVKAGTATITVSAAAKGNYAAAKKTIKVTVKQGAQTLTFKSQTKRVYLSKVKKANQVVAITKAKGAKTAVTYKKVKVSKKAANFTVNKTSGKITVKKGTPKGTYKVTVRATAAATANWKVTSKPVVITINVK